MATIFEWSGKTSRGIVESGEITANSKDEVITQLRKRNITATIVKAKEKKPPFGGLSFGGGVNDKDIVIFTRQFATMIDAGLPLFRPLRYFQPRWKINSWPKHLRPSKLMLNQEQPMLMP